MKQTKITIAENGRVSVPENVSMRAFEIADLFGVYTQTINANIKAVIKSGVVRPDLSGHVVVDGNTTLPLDFGLDMITALAFRVHSHKADIFREWVICRMTRESAKPMPVYIRLPNGAIPN